MRGMAGIVWLAVVAAPLGACAPVFSDLQSARLAGPGRVEVTPSGSMLYFGDEGEVEHVENHYGAQVGIGLRDGLDLRLRYEHAAGVNVVGFGPKLGIIQDRLALNLPVGCALGEGSSDSWQFHPTLIATRPLGPSAELNASAKGLIPISGEGGDTLVAFNLGLGLGDLEVWAIRPEVGVLFNPGESGYYLQTSLGLTLSVGQVRR